MPDPELPLRWNVATRIAFRFSFLYLGLFCLTTQILGGMMSNPWVDLPDLAKVWPFRPLTLWMGAHVFHYAQPLAFASTGSGDKAFDWVSAFGLLVFAVAAAILWSVLDRKRLHYRALSVWFGLFVRMALSTQLIYYGLSKVYDLQMSPPGLGQLLQPLGTFSPMGLLWVFMGASRSYEVLTGWAELSAGILLVFPRTALIGAVIALADMTQVFVLNMTYDVPVKLHSFHLILLALYLLRRDLPRLANVLLWNRTADPVPITPLFRSRRANRIALAMQALYGAWAIYGSTMGLRVAWQEMGRGGKKSALQGIWEVDQITIDGAPRPALLTDGERWRRAIFDDPGLLLVQRTDESERYYGLTLDEKERTLALKRYSDPDWKALLHYRRDQDRLTLEGDLDGHPMHAELKLQDMQKFELVSRGFHWIQETPYNR